MKKHINILLSAMLLPCMVSAQQSTPIYAAYYEVEGTTVYEAWGAPPGSNMAFYSLKGGGRLLKDAAVEGAGGVKLMAAPGFAPLMVVNNGTGGSKMVAYYDDKAFTLDALQATAAAGSHTLSWKASVADAPHTTFTVLAGADGLTYAPVATLPAVPGGTAPYSFAEKMAAGSYYYRIQVQNSRTGHSYTTRALHIVPEADIQVYPTAAHNYINIAVPPACSGASYELIQAGGSIAGSGRLAAAPVTTVGLSALAPGSYVIRIFDKDNQCSFHKFTKL